VFLETFANASVVNRFAFSGRATADAGVARLTPNSGNSAGSVVFREPQDLSSWRATFRFYCGEADGITLAMFRGSGPGQLGAIGSGLGVRGLDGYAVEFDTWGGPGDIDSNHVAFDETLNLVPLSQGPVSASMRYQWFDAEVVFDHGHVQVFLESAAASYPRTLVLDYTLQDFSGFEGYLGFTGSTGGVSGLHYVDDFLLVVE
jgi:hypothetical protein